MAENKTVHPNLVKRPQRARDSMVDRHAYYFPRGITANNLISIGSRIQIMEFEHKGGKDLSMVKIVTQDGIETSAMFSDLAFIK
jgi:hypothetical protein